LTYRNGASKPYRLDLKKNLRSMKKEKIRKNTSIVTKRIEAI
jgi:hypothetical protein